MRELGHGTGWKDMGTMRVRGTGKGCLHTQVYLGVCWAGCSDLSFLSHDGWDVLLLGKESFGTWLLASPVRE